MKPERVEELTYLLHEMARKMMEDFGYNETPALLAAVEPGPNGRTIIGPLPIMRRGHAYATVQSAILGLPFKPVLVCLSSDTYSKKYEASDMENMPPEVTDEMEGRMRPLAERFAEGDPGVTEALNTLAMSEFGSRSILQPYKYTPADGWEWGEIDSNPTSDWDFERLISGQPRLDYKGRPLCPRCGHFIPNDQQPGEYPGALSRANNITEICSQCGLEEAINGMVRSSN